MPAKGKRHIAIFLPSLRGGGAERVVANLAKGFVGCGHRVDLIVAKADGPYLRDVPAAVRLIDLNCSGVMLALPKLVRFFKSERPDAFLSALTHANIVSVWARLLGGRSKSCKLLLSEHSTLSHITCDRDNIKRRMMPLLVRHFFKMSDAVVAVSRGVAEDLATAAGVPKSMLHIIYNPVINEEILEKACEPLYHPWFAEEGAPVVLAVGRLTPAKDYPTLLKAFALVRKEFPAKLIILGDGEEKRNLLALINNLRIEEDVDIHGFVENPYHYMKRAAVLALSSKWEGFGNVIVEAMAVGTPVVSTDCPGPREILEDGQWGSLVPVADPEAMAVAIVKSIRSPRIGSKARGQFFTVTQAVDGYLDLLLKH